MKRLLITKFNYLKTPTYSWSYVNDQGGSFSNSGSNHRSLKGVLKHAMANLVGLNWDTRFQLEVLEGFDKDDRPISVYAESHIGRHFKGDFE